MTEILASSYQNLRRDMALIYGDAYVRNSEHLGQLLTEGVTGHEKFLVVPLEAGIGKSLETDRIIGEYLASAGPRGFLLVKKFVEEVNASTDRINAYQINELLIPWAVGISHKNWRDYRDKLTEYF